MECEEECRGMKMEDGKTKKQRKQTCRQRNKENNLV